MTWLRSYWPHVLAALAVLALVAVTRAWAGAVGEANALRDLGERQTLVIDAQREALLESRREVMEAHENERRATERAEAAVADLSDVRRRLDAVGDSVAREIRAQADSSGGWIRIELHDQEIAAKDAQLAAADERGDIWEGRARLLEAHIDRDLMPYIGELEQQNEALEARDATRLLEIEALRSAVAPSFIGQIFNSPITHALAAGIGFAGGVAAS